MDTGNLAVNTPLQRGEQFKFSALADTFMASYAGRDPTFSNKLHFFTQLLGDIIASEIDADHVEDCLNALRKRGKLHYRAGTKPGGTGELTYKPLADATITFDSEKYLQSKMKDIAKISGIRWGIGDQGEIIGSPIFDILKIYKNYFKLAAAGKITREILRENNDAYIDQQYAWVNPTMHKEVSYFDDDLGITRTDWVPLDGDKFDLYNPVLPMVNQFALFAALSNAYLKEGDQNQSVGFAIRAAQVWGRIDRYSTELTNSFHIENEATMPLRIARAREILDGAAQKSADAAKGGRAKGKKGVATAGAYWILCSESPQYEALLKKHPRMGRKFSDELFDLIKAKEQSGEIAKIEYGSAWFYENVTLKFRNKK